MKTETLQQTTPEVAGDTAPAEAAIIVKPAKRPNRVNSKTRQRVLICADNSGSMAGDKARQAHAGCQELNDHLALPENRGGFYVGMVLFNERAETVRPWTATAALVGNIAPLNPNGSTDVAACFDAALAMLRDAQQADDGQQEYVYLRPVVFFYSDGNQNRGADPRSVANEVKALADVITIAIGTDANDKLLMELATSPSHFYKVTDAKALRAFLAEAGPTITQTFQRGEDATVITTQMRAQ